MAKNKGHENLIPCKKGESGNPNGRPKKLHSQVIADLKANGAEAVNKNMISQTYEVFLSLNEIELNRICNDKEEKMLHRILAKAMLSKEGFKNLETMLDRVHGKAMITQEIKQENIGDTIKVIFETTRIAPVTNEDDIIDA